MSDPTDTTPDTPPDDTPDTPAEEPEPPRPLLTLRDGLPHVVETESELRGGVRGGDRGGSGPVAIDAERASGYRYSSRAYLIQLRREGAGTSLIDPIAFDSLAPLQDGARRHRVDPARRHPGPALPRRARPATDPAVRHRARRPAARLPAGRAGHAGRDAARLTGWPRSTRPSTGRPGRCPSRGWSTPPSTSRCWSSSARRWSPSSRRPARPSGRGRSSTSSGASYRRRGPSRGGVRRGCTRCAAAAAWPPSAACGRPATRSPPGAT